MEFVDLLTLLLSVWSAGEPSAKLPSDVYRLFASKTAYDQVRSRQAIREYNVPGCIPKQFYLLSRHGTRYPAKKKIEQMQEFLPFLQNEILQKQSLFPSSLEQLSKWHLLLDSTYDMKLSPTGYKELQELAIRYKERFPGLLNRTYNEKSFDTLFTSAERTNSSMKQLLAGFFGSQVANTVVLDPSKENDKLLRYYANCGKSQQDDHDSASEHDKFVMGPEMTSLLQNISDRLQLNWCLSYHGMYLVYDICRYESAWDPQALSPWCTVFTADDLKLLEYGDDLQSYYDHGYGQAVNSEHACPPVRDLVNHFRVCWHSMSARLLVTALAGLLAVVGKSSATLCYAKENSPYKLYASKTSYGQVHGWDTQEVKYPGCEVKHFYLLSRHGTRYPDSDDIKEMQERLPNIQKAIVEKEKLCKEDITNLKNWKLTIDPTADETLAPAGDRELQEIAQRYKARFPSLLNASYSQEYYSVRYTSTQRTNASARNFVIGLFGNSGKNIPLPWSSEDDALLKFYKTCALWKQTIDKNESALAEADRFKRGKKMKEVVKDVSKRLNLKGNLTRSDIRLMYSMCRFDAAWEPEKLSPWCAVFKKDDLKILEYLEDLKYYYNHGYGYELNYKQACPPVRDIVNHYRDIMAGKATDTAALRFSHSGMMLKVLARLNLFHDRRPLTADNYKKQKERQWRTSLIDSFSSNVAFVLAQCEGNEYKVATFLQEKPLRLPGCSANLCPVHEFMTQYANIADGCDVPKVCQLS